MALGVGGEVIAGGGERRLLADAGEHVLQRAALGHVVEHVVGRHQRDAGALRGAGEMREAAVIAGAVGEVRHQADGAGEGVAESGEGCVENSVRSRTRHDAEHHAGAPFEKIGEVEVALALLGAAVADGEQAAEAAVGGAVGRPGDDVGRAVAEGEAAADGVPDANFLRHEMTADHAGKRVAVGDGDASEAEFRRLTTNSSGCEPPRRNEKLVVTASSAKAPEIGE